MRFLGERPVSTGRYIFEPQAGTGKLTHPAHQCIIHPRVQYNWTAVLVSSATPGSDATECFSSANQTYQAPISGTQPSLDLVLILSGLRLSICRIRGAQPEKSVLMNSISGRSDSRSLTFHWTHHPRNLRMPRFKSDLWSVPVGVVLAGTKLNPF